MMPARGYRSCSTCFGRRRPEFTPELSANQLRPSHKHIDGGPAGGAARDNLNAKKNEHGERDELNGYAKAV